MSSCRRRRQQPRAPASGTGYLPVYAGSNTHERVLSRAEREHAIGMRDCTRVRPRRISIGLGEPVDRHKY